MENKVSKKVSGLSATATATLGVATTPVVSCKVSAIAGAAAPVVVMTAPVAAVIGLVDWGVSKLFD